MTPTRPPTARGLVVLALTALGAVAWSVLVPGHRVTNGARIYYQLDSVITAAPRTASNIQRHVNGASWIEGCTLIPGSRSGWSAATASLSFTDTRPRAAVTADISRALFRYGWRRHDAAPGPHRGRIAHWTLDGKSGHRAQAWAFPAGPGDHNWYVSSSWTPPGPRGQGCP